MWEEGKDSVNNHKIVEKHKNTGNEREKRAPSLFFENYKMLLKEMQVGLRRQEGSQWSRKEDNILSWLLCPRCSSDSTQF